MTSQKDLESILVVGGGMAGIHAVLELADLGYSVYLIEEKPSLGGKAAQLGKVFPTDDCALCLTASEVQFKTGGFRKCLYRSALTLHPRIRVLTLSRVRDVGGEAGNFIVKTEVMPRYVNENCISCGVCSEVCPIEAPNPLNFNLNHRKAIFAPFPQSIPNTYVVDMGACIRCGKCVEVCPTKAINLEDAPKEVEIRAGAIIVATGFDELDPTIIKEYGYGFHQKVITQLQLARMLDPTGPTRGEVVKNHKPVKRVAMVMCVGSRDMRANQYCSKICCIYSLKHALLLRERGVEVVVFYMDLRTMGEYEEYFSRARGEGVVFVRGRVGSVEEDPLTGELKLMVENTLTSELLETDADLVVLTAGLIPSEGTKNVAKMLGIETDSYGFLKGNPSKLSAVETNVRGVFVCGSAQSPKDIPDSVVQAKAAAMRAAQLLQEVGKMAPVAKG